MCAVSFVGDHFRDRWQDRPWFPQTPAVWPPVEPVTLPAPQQIMINHTTVTRQEFDDLKRQVLEMKDLLKRAKIYDEQIGQPDCEMEEKMDVLRKVAKLVGVDLDDVLGKRAAV